MINEVKICDNCGHKNPVNSVECIECGYDLTFVYPQMIEASTSKTITESPERARDDVLDGTLGGERWFLSPINCVENGYLVTTEMALGRDCDVFNEYFNRSNYTSRIHAKIRLCECGVQIMDASTNGTYINDRRLPKLEWITISDGDKIRFADVAFQLRRCIDAD